MSDVPAGKKPAQEIPFEEIPALLPTMVPECADSVAEMFHQPAETAVLTEDAAVMLYELPAGCFTTPVLMPQLRSDSPDTDLLTRCWDFVERIVDHPTQHVGGAVYFEVLDQLLTHSGLVGGRLALHKGTDPGPHAADARRLRRPPARDQPAPGTAQEPQASALTVAL
ncbi:hypothetical protein [Streptomyces sp. NPDC004065]|uniref:hypothetical protein n=1 Tax=Streptomyces sp. NPDC004065 TaxID=3364689 RepID=UPI00384B6A46